MSRGFYQNTMALVQGDGTLKALAGINVFVYQPGTTTLATIYQGRTGAAQATNPALTDPTGLVEFYADVGEYDVRTKDTNVVPRIADRTVAWSAFNGSSQGLPSALLARDNGLDLTTLAADVLRQVIPIGQVIDWWRPDGTIPLPAGFEVCDGRVIAAGQHDFAGWTGNAITLPDLRNKFILGADILKADGSASNNGDGVAAFNAVHPNAPGIRGIGGSNASKNFQHTHGIPDHSHSGQTTGMTRNNPHGHNIDGTNAGGAPPVFGGGDIYGAQFHDAGGAGYMLQTTNAGSFGFSMHARDVDINHEHNVTLGAGANANTNPQTVNQNWTANPGTDMRPQHVGLLKLMKVRRS